MPGQRIETEAKWRVGDDDHDRLRDRLRQFGATHVSTCDETNTLLDTADESLRREGRVLRIRVVAGGETLLTFKGPAAYRDGVKSRDEAEVTVEDGSTALSIFEGLGFLPVLEYRKSRDTWRLDGALVALDTLAFGHFVEIEGADADVRRAAARLGLRLDQTIERGYPALMRAHLAKGQRRTRPDRVS
jgi:predicted adenylyl cyclase CyaB